MEAGRKFQSLGHSDEIIKLLNVNTLYILKLRPKIPNETDIATFGE